MKISNYKQKKEMTQKKKTQKKTKNFLKKQIV